MVLLGLASASPANVFSADGTDPRGFVAPGGPEERRLRPTGAVSAEFTLRKTRTLGAIAPGGGTAFMVSPCYAMASYHVLFGDTGLVIDPMQVYQVTVRFPPASEGGAPRLVRGIVQYWGSATGTDPDLALILLTGCPGQELGWYDLPDAQDRRLLPSRGLAMAGFSGDRSMTRLSLQRGCAVHAYMRRRGWLLHDCASRQGASGAPILAGARGVPLVIGINSGEFDASQTVLKAYEARRANWAVATIAIGQKSRLRSMIRHDLERARAANPLAAENRTNGPPGA